MFHFASNQRHGAGSPKYQFLCSPRLLATPIHEWSCAFVLLLMRTTTTDTGLLITWKDTAI